MTTAAPDTPALAPTARGLWTRSRGPLLALLLLVVSGVVLGALQSGEQHGQARSPVRGPDRKPGPRPTPGRPRRLHPGRDHL